MKRQQILKQAEELTSKDRQESYGAPYLNHLRIAALWSAYLETKITPEQVAICQVLVKISRSMESFKEDNFIDGAAYLAIACELAEIAQRQGQTPASDK